MASYRFYNISLLPRDPRNIKEVGAEGYKNLLKNQRELLIKASKERNLGPISFPLRNEMFLAIFSIHIEDKYAHGQFIKYDQPESIKDLFTGEDITKVEKGGSAHRFLFDFVYNFENHTLGIENKGAKLPGPVPIMRALEIIFMDNAGKNFPDHILEIGQVTSSSAVEDAYRKASLFKRGEVEVTFSNSVLYDEAIAAQYEKEMKEKGIHKTTLVESAAQGGFMTDLSDKFKALLHIAKTTTSKGLFRYVDSATQKIKTFHLSEHPYEKQLIRHKGENDQEFHQRVIRASELAIQQGTQVVNKNLIS